MFTMHLEVYEPIVIVMFFGLTNLPAVITWQNG